MRDHDYQKTIQDHCVHSKNLQREILLYPPDVDDMMIIGHGISNMVYLQKAMNKFFAMQDLRLATQILGKLRLSEGRYIQKILKRFNMQNDKLVSSPLVGHFEFILQVRMKGENMKKSVMRLQLVV